MIVVGVSAPDAKPNDDGATMQDSSSYCMTSQGEVGAPGKALNNVPDSSVVQSDEFRRRPRVDQAFRQYDDVLVTLDCGRHTLHFQTPTVDHVIAMQQQHHRPEQQWVLSVNMKGHFSAPQSARVQVQLSR